MDKKRIISEELKEKRERGRMGAREEGRERGRRYERGREG